MADVSPITFEDAYRRGHMVYELRMSNWGNVGATRDPGVGGQSYVSSSPSLWSPVLGRPIRGIAISPSSDFSGCIVTRDLGPLSQVSLTTPGSVLQQDLVVSAGTPLLFEQAAGNSTRGASAIRIRPRGEDLYADTYTAENGSTQAFGGTLGPLQYYPPELRVLLLLHDSVMQASTRTAWRIGMLGHTFAGAGEELIRIVPATGRRRVRVAGLTEAGTTVTLRVTGIAGRWFVPAIAPYNPIDSTTEIELGTVNIGAADSGSIFVENPMCSWLLIKATRTGGANDMEYGVVVED
jgi:hypothetical protein